MKIFIISIFINLLFFFNISYAESIYFIDFTKVLNQSIAGAAAQKKLQDSFQQENEKFTNEEQKLKKLESELISQKKILSNEEYQKKVQELRNQVSKLQKDKLASLNSIAESRSKAKKKLLDIVNPIISKYMAENNIRLVIEKQTVILGDTKLEITDRIIEILNKELKTLNIN